MILERGFKYKLTADEIELIKKMSADICSQDRSYFIDNFKRDKSTKLYNMNLNGFGAELAFCRLCDVIFDSSTDKNKNHFNNPDAVLHNNITVDVKTTVYKNGKLLVRKGKEEKRVDIYVLMVGEFPVFMYMGWADYDKIINPDTIINLGYGETYSMIQEKLNKALMYL